MRERDVSELSALLVADMELRGAARVAWIEQTYLGDRGRWTPGLQAMLLALSEQGNANAAAPRARIVGAYRRFIRSGHPLAGYVAPDLPALAGLERGDRLCGADPIGRAPAAGFGLRDAQLPRCCTAGRRARCGGAR